MNDAETALKRAMDWIAGELREHPRANRLDLIDRAARRYMLSPSQSEALAHRFLERRPPRAGSRRPS
ncbi:MAG: hypothetical protein ACE147_20565 [Candidatus Methylomirabilales bacterium]